MFYVDVADHVRELWFDLSQGPKWHHNDVITSAGVSHGDRHSAVAKAALTSYALKSSGHLLFIGADNHLHEMWFDAAQGLSWHHNDITASTGAPLPLAGTPLTNFSLVASVTLSTSTINMTCPSFISCSPVDLPRVRAISVGRRVLAPRFLLYDDG